ncbi:MAG: LCP family protein [Clostridiales bacterium]|nr:LCP family protein [Clostridiales bacterium]
MAKNTYFETDKKLKKKKIRRIAFSITALVVFTAVFSLIFVLPSYNYSLYALITGESPKENNEEGETEEVNFDSFEKNYLFYCFDEEKKNLDFVLTCLVTAPDGGIEVEAFSPGTSVTSGSSTMSLSSYYLTGGVNSLKEAVEILGEKKIDSYLGSDPSSFKSVIDYTGTFKISPESPINYRGDDFNLTLPKGESNVKGDTLYKYLLFLSFTGSDGIKKQAETVKDIILTSLSEENLNRADSVFSKITNNLTTDITVLDYKRSEDVIKYMVKNKKTLDNS